MRPWRLEESTETPEEGITRGSEPPDKGAGNQTLVLKKSSKRSQPQSHLSDTVFYFYCSFTHKYLVSSYNFITVMHDKTPFFGQL